MGFKKELIEKQTRFWVLMTAGSAVEVGGDTVEGSLLVGAEVGGLCQVPEQQPAAG